MQLTHLTVDITVIRHITFTDTCHVFRIHFVYAHLLVSSLPPLTQYTYARQRTPSFRPRQDNTVCVGCELKHDTHHAPCN